MKKGQTESYSFLIGIIITVLILTAIGCAAYNMYKPKSADYFGKLTDLLKKLEKGRIDVEEGEITFYTEKDQALIGFGENQDYIKEESCYGMTLAAEKPSKCLPGKSCLCLCNTEKVTEIRKLILKDGCQNPVKCETFDTLNIKGGEGCPEVLVPGQKDGEKRGTKILYYSKQGDTVSIDDEKALLLKEK